MMNISAKQRLLNAIKGEEADHIPFSPFLAYYFDSVSNESKEKGQLAYLEGMGADPLLRGFIRPFALENEKYSCTERIEGNKKYVTRSTSGGDLYSEYTYLRESNTWFLTRHPVSTLEDLYLLKDFYQDIKVTNQVEAMDRYLDDIGERALVLSLVGCDMKSSFQSLLEHWIGTENLIYMCMDYPDLIQEILEVMYKKSKRTIEYTTMSKTCVSTSWEDSSTTNISPALYQKYIAPEITGWCDTLKEKDILYVQHACGHIRDLLIPMSSQGIAGIESLTPFPTGNISISEAVGILPQNVSIIGGIDPIMMLNSSIEEIDVYVRDLLKITKGRGFVLANSDSCPPFVEYDKFLYLSNLVKKIHV